MRNILLLATALFLLQGIFARSYTATSILHQTTNLNFIVFPQSPIVPVNMVKKKMTLKERILLKWYKKKISRSVSEEKVTVKLLGNLSLWSVLLVLPMAFIPFGIFISLLLIPTSLILGIISLKRRNKLTDKTGISKWPALIGIILSSLIILFAVVFIVSGGTE
jgi:hypothetical protein